MRKIKNILKKLLEGFNKNLSWESGVRQELNYWKKYFKEEGSIHEKNLREDYQARCDANSIFQYPEYLPEESLNVKILDVGAGPLTVLGKKFPGKNLIITAVDALGSQYKNIIPFEPLVKTEQCHSENLLEYFGEEAFDITHARNTLDHAKCPYEAFIQMIKCTKKGGFIITNHSLNEATLENWSGFHKWNFYIDGNSLIMEDKDGVKFNSQRDIGSLIKPVLVNGSKKALFICQKL